MTNNHLITRITKRWLGDFVALFVVGLLVLVVAERNIVPGTWFLGWDSVMSELNYWENFRRSLVGVWQSNQGLGLVGGHGYVSDLVHVSLLWMMSWIVPLNYLRYVFAFLMWWIGGVGAYFFGKRLLNESKESGGWIVMFGLVASAVYMMHLFTVQNFYVQLDSFLWFFAGLPWGLYLLWGLLKKYSKKKLIGYLLFHCIFSFIGFIPPVFLGYLLVVALVLAGFVINSRNLESLKRSLVIGATVVVGNLYWMMPVGYYSLTNSDVYLNSKLNRLTTPENVVKSEEYGKLEDVVSGKGFYFDALDFLSSEEKAVPIMKPWIEQTDKILVSGVMWALFCLAIIGWVSLLVRKNRLESKTGLALAGVVVLGLMALGTFPLSLISELLRTVPMFNQAFRIPFTKFSSLYVLLEAVFVMMGVLEIKILAGKLNKRLAMMTGILTTGVVIVLIMIVFSPSFEGKMIYDRARVDLPNEYLEVIEYFANQPANKRIAMMPVHSYNGWYIQDWGYTGSGFLFYGLRQPVLDRAFDVWSKQNETFYKQLSRAVYLQDERLLLQVLEKFDVSFLLLDTSVVNLSEGEKSFKAEDLMLWLGQNAGLENVWNSGNLTVFTVVSEHESAFVDSMVGSVLSVNGVDDYLIEDEIMQRYGEYVSREGVWFPFSSVNSERIEGVEVMSGFTGGNRLLFTSERIVSQEKEIFLPDFSEGAFFSTPVEVLLDGARVVVDPKTPMIIRVGGKVVHEYNLPKFEMELGGVYDSVLVKIGGRSAIVNQGLPRWIDRARFEVGKSVEVQVYLGQPVMLDSFVNEAFFNTQVTKCWERSGTTGVVEDQMFEGYRKIAVNDASGCLSFKLGHIGNKTSLVEVALPFRSYDGSRPNFCINKEGGDFQCLNEDVYNKTVASESWNDVVRSFVAEENSIYWMDISARPADEKGKPSSIDYQPPKFKLYELIVGADFNQGVWDTFLNQVVVTDFQSGAMEIEIAGFEDSVDLETSTRQVLPNCDPWKRGEVNKIFEGRVVYHAVGGGAGCDFSLMDEISQELDHLVKVDAGVIAGKGMKVYITNLADERNVSEEIILKESERAFLPVLRWNNLDDLGYKIVFETRSFGSSEAKNWLGEIEVFALPADWLSNVRVGNAAEFVINSNLLVDGDKDLLCRWQCTHKVAGAGILKLSQSYDEGWMGYKINSRSMPFFAWVGGQKLEHVKVNGWANGWIIDDGQCLDECSVTMIFWPQYLQWLGFGILGLSVVSLTAMSLRRAGARRLEENTA